MGMSAMSPAIKMDQISLNTVNVAFIGDAAYENIRVHD